MKSVLLPLLLLSLAACPAAEDGTGETGTTSPDSTPDPTTPDPTTTDSPTTPDPTTTDAGPYTLDLDGSGYEFAQTRTIHGVVVDQATGDVVGDDSMVMGADGLLALTFPKVLEAGGLYEVVWFADVNGDGTCTGPNVEFDRAWSAPVPKPTGDTTVIGDFTFVLDDEACQYWP